MHTVEDLLVPWTVLEKIGLYVVCCNILMGTQRSDKATHEGNTTTFSKANNDNLSFILITQTKNKRNICLQRFAKPRILLMQQVSDTHTYTYVFHDINGVRPSPDSHYPSFSLTPFSPFLPP